MSTLLLTIPPDSLQIALEIGNLRKALTRQELVEALSIAPPRVEEVPALPPAEPRRLPPASTDKPKQIDMVTYALRQTGGGRTRDLIAAIEERWPGETTTKNPVWVSSACLRLREMGLVKRTGKAGAFSYTLDDAPRAEKKRSTKRRAA